METIYPALRWIHVAAGAVALATGLFQLVRPKQGALHRRIGRVYCITMVVVCTSALVNSAYRIGVHQQPGAVFLAALGVFGLFLTLTGYRYGRRKSAPPATADRWLALTGIAAALALFATGAWVYTKGITMLVVICLVFGLIQLLMAAEDYRYAFHRKISARYGPLTWKFTHLGRITGSYIAAVTAFFVNTHVLPFPLLNWLLPTIAGTAAIAGFSAYFAKKHRVGRFAGLNSTET